MCFTRASPGQGCSLKLDSKAGLCKDGARRCNGTGREFGKRLGEVSMLIAVMTAATVSGVATLACYAAAQLQALSRQSGPAAA